MGWAVLAAPLLVFVATWGLTGRLIPWLAGRAILDHPVERSSHQAPVPRGGGLALVPVLLAAWLALTLFGAAPAGAAGIVALAGALAFLSWRDDRESLPAGLRLLGHVAAAGLGVLLLPQGAVFQGWLSPLLDRAAAAFLWAWFVNLFNFMDGIDGIAGIETAALGIGVALVAPGAGPAGAGTAALAVSTAAGALAFLRWNWHPARVFLGDVGSVPLGFLLGWLLLGLAAEGAWAPALILPLYYLADASLTLAARVLRGERFWEAHRQHFYQRALGKDGDHAAVARLILSGDAVLVGLAILALWRPWLALALALLAVAVLLALLERRAGS